MKRLALIICFVLSVQASWPLNSNSDEDESDFPSPPRIPVEDDGNDVPKIWWNSNRKNRNEKSWWWGVDNNGKATDSWWWGNKKNEAWWAVPTRDTFDVCRVSNNKVETVAGVPYKYPDTTCHTVLLKDCASEPTFSVALKRVHENKDHWVMRIVTQENTIHLKHTKEIDNLVQVYLNDKLYSDKSILEVIENDVTVSRIVKQEEFTSVTLPLVGVQIAFDGYNTVLRIDKTKSAQFCGGICNHVESEENVDPVYGFVEREINEELHKKYISDNEC